MKEIAIIGGGASGLTAAIAAARNAKEAKVFILEHKDTLGKKILSTGNGRCNLTNEYMDLSCFRSDNPGVAEQILQRFGVKDTIRFFEELGIVVKSRNGYIYPRSGQASSVLDVLRMEAERAGVEAYTGVHVTGLKKAKKGYHILTDKQTCSAEKVILSTGGRASSALGSDGSGYELAKQMGHHMIPVVPALVQLKVKKHPFSEAAGVRTDAKVAAYVNGKKMAEDTGELQMTAYGISGIPVFQISRYVAKALYKKENAKVSVDFLPDMKENETEVFFQNRKRGRNEMTAGDFLTGIFHKKLIPRMLKMAGIPIKKKVKSLTKEDMQKLCRCFKQTILEIEDTNGFDHAQACAGGVSLQEIHSNTMESRYVKGLYLAGELLDVDGICGGYNLQWAWATGYIAGKDAAKS